MILSRRNALLTAGAISSLHPTKASVQTERPLMKQRYIGWEAGNLNNNGANAYCQAISPITITGCQLIASMAPTGKPNAGFCEALILIAAAPSIPTFTDPPHEYYNIPSISGGEADWQPLVVNNPNNIALNGGMGSQDNIASWILKSDGQQCPNVPITRTNIAIYVPAGGCIVVHIDHYGDSGADVEIQGSIEYR